MLSEDCSGEAMKPKSQTKRMFITFFDIKCTVHCEFIPQAQTGNRAYYVETLKRSREAVRRKSLNFGPTIGFSTITML
jgi:hypothetical protein